jgi:hypothetical protein
MRCTVVGQLTTLKLRRYRTHHLNGARLSLHCYKRYYGDAFTLWIITPSLLDLHLSYIPWFLYKTAFALRCNSIAV